MQTSCEWCWIPMAKENIQREKYLRVNTTSIKKPHCIAFSPLLTMVRELDTDFNKLLLESKFILPGTLNIKVKNIELNLYLIWKYSHVFLTPGCSDAVLHFSIYFQISSDSHRNVCQEFIATTLTQSATNRRGFNTRWQYAFAKYLSEVPVDIGKYFSNYYTISYFCVGFRHTVFIWFALK